MGTRKAGAGSPPLSPGQHFPKEPLLLLVAFVGMVQGTESSIWHPRSLSTALTSSLCPSHLPPELEQLEVGGWLSQGWLLLGCQRPPGCGKTPLVGFVVSRSPERSHQLRIARVTSPVSWRGVRQLPQIPAMEQCKQEQGLVTCSSLIPFCFYRCTVHGN